jgi:hypothetical protein
MENTALVLGCRMEEVVRNEVIKVLSNDYRNIKAKEELLKQSTSDLLVTLHNWKGRFISQNPRSVFCSEELKENPLMKEVQEGLHKLQNLIREGGNLTPFLSKKVKNLHYKDSLLNIWNVHHLHIPQGKKKRSNFLLFAVFHNQSAYLINIYPHGKWHDINILRVIARNWPDNNIVFEIQDESGWANELNDQDYVTFSKKRANTFFQMGEKSYMPCSGVTHSGHAIGTIIFASQVLHKENTIYDCNTHQLEAKVGFTVLDDWCGFYDLSSGKIINSWWYNPF